MFDYKKLQDAIKILGLGQEATLEEIKNNYRELSLKYHPDRCKEKDKIKCEEMFKKINNAHKIIMTYCANYKYSFKDSDIENNFMNKKSYEHLRRFYDNWWGDID